METAQEFTARALRLRAQAKALCFKFGDDDAELHYWMGVARQRGMTWDTASPLRLTESDANHVD